MPRRSVVKLEALPTNEAIVIHTPVLVLPRKINPQAYNPRTISKKDFDALKMSIKTFGFLDPICVQKKGMGIIGGHQRVKAITELCVEMGIQVPAIPCIVLDIEDREAKKLNVMLNNVGGEFDARLLGQLLASLHTEKPLTLEETSFMGFEQSETDNLLRLVDAIPPLPTDTTTTFGSSVTLSLSFNDVRLRDAVKKTLADKAETSGQKTGDLIATLLGCKVR